MPNIYDNSGNLVAEIPLSDNQMVLLSSGANIMVQFHTPIRLRGILGGDNGSFVVHGQNPLTTDDPATVKRYAEMQKAIKAFG